MSVVAVVAKMVDAVALDAISVVGVRVRAPPTARDWNSIAWRSEVAKKKESPKKRGPKPDTLKLEGDWKDAVKKALGKGKPPKHSGS
jgi:hypothetical protein